MRKLTKQAINRLLKAPVKVTLFNGCYNVASIRADFSRYSVEMRVEVTHPLLEWQCGKKDGVSLIYWEGCSGFHIDLPNDLLFRVEELEEAGTMGDEEALEISRRNSLAFMDAVEALGLE